jgi:hypothetical protein
MQARYKHTIARFSQGAIRRARFEQQRLIALHGRRPAAADPGLVMRFSARALLGLQLACIALGLALLAGCHARIVITDPAPQACGVKA